jgi:tetratricopeptide (TPR) repeat protein
MAHRTIHPPTHGRAWRLWLLAAVALVAAPAQAQRPRDAILIFPPTPEDRGADSSYAVQLAAEIRDGLIRWRRHAVRVIEFCLEDELCEEFPPPQLAFDVARHLRADIYVLGEFRRASPNPMVDLRILETARQGGVPHFTTALTVVGDSALLAVDFARDVRDSLKAALQTVQRAARHATECWEGVRERDYERAHDRAARAFEVSANHPSAARCLSYVYLATQNSDSLVWALERAVAGDPGMTDAWEELGLEYARRGDTVRAVQARISEVRSDPNDAPRRMRAARVLHTMGEESAAVALVREGAARAGGDLEFRGLLARMCFEYRMWRCALESYTELYVLDSSVVADTAFYQRIIAVAQTLADTAAVDRWTHEAVENIEPEVRAAWERAERARLDAERAEQLLNSFRMARASVLADVGQPDSALVIYRGIASADPQDARAPIAAAQLLTQERFLVVERGTPLDSVILRSADSLLMSAMRRSAEPEVHHSAALVYLEVGSRLVQRRVAPLVALDWLEKALTYEADSTLQQRATALTGIAYFYLVEDSDTAVREQQTCDQVEYEAELVAQGLARVPSVQRQFPELGANVTSALAAYEQLLPAYRRSLQCEATSAVTP